MKASIAITQFDNLIEATLVDRDNLNIQQEIGDTWNAIRKTEVNPTKFIETKRTMLARLQKTIKSFGEVRVPYAGPECGLGSWPTYDSAIEGLRRVSGVVEDYNRKKYG